MVPQDRAVGPHRDSLTRETKGNQGLGAAAESVLDFRSVSSLPVHSAALPTRGYKAVVSPHPASEMVRFVWNFGFASLVFLISGNFVQSQKI